MSYTFWKHALVSTGNNNTHAKGHPPPPKKKKKQKKNKQTNGQKKSPMMSALKYSIDPNDIDGLFLCILL